MRRRRPFSLPPLSLALLLPLPLPILAASRPFTLLNSCSEPLWTAITNFGAHQTYEGPRGFLQEAGNETKIEVPSPWNGRIWARRSCEFDEEGKGKCVTGDCEGKLECDHGTIGTVNVGEFNLDSWEGNDFWDQSCVPGWTIPMKIEPLGEGCESVSCTIDANAACPDDRMKVKDDEGNTLACIAACFAGINADEPSMNCCSGKYNDLDACVSDQVDYYSVLKPMCEHAYWYPYDSRPNYPTVDYACAASGDPGYRIEFCPDGVGTGTAPNGTGGASQSAASETGLASPVPQSSGSAGGDMGEKTEAEGGSRSSTDGGGKTAAGPTATGGYASSSASSDSSSAATSSSSSSDDDDETILGLSRPVFFALVAGLVALLLLALFACSRRQREPVQGAPTAVETSSSDLDGGSSTSESSGSEDEGGRRKKERSLGLLRPRYKQRDRLLSGT
ncbi:hypothetical protein JCM10213_006058 [Rhodosporidiobolus nylandii]